MRFFITDVWCRYTGQQLENTVYNQVTFSVPDLFAWLLEHNVDYRVEWDITESEYDTGFCLYEVMIAIDDPSHQALYRLRWDHEPRSPADDARVWRWFPARIQQDHRSG